MNFAYILSQQKPSLGPDPSLTPVPDLQPICITDSTHLRTLNTVRYCIKTPVLWIRIGFNAHPDPAFLGPCRSGSRDLMTYSKIVKL